MEKKLTHSLPVQRVRGAVGGSTGFFLARRPLVCLSQQLVVVVAELRVVQSHGLGCCHRIQDPSKSVWYLNPLAPSHWSVTCQGRSSAHSILRTSEIEGGLAMVTSWLPPAELDEATRVSDAG